MGFIKGLAKYILFLLNALMLIAGIALIAVGAVYHIKNMGPDIMHVVAFTISVGVIIALLSFFGCYGVVKESRRLLTTYAFIMITIFIVQVVLIVFTFLATQNDNSKLDKGVLEFLESIYEKNLKSGAKNDVDDIQKQFDCCGLNRDYSLVESSKPGYLIDSCCGSKYKGSCTKEHAHEADCFLEVRDFTARNIKTIAGIAIAVAIVEIVAAVFALCVRGSIDKHNQ